MKAWLAFLAAATVGVLSAVASPPAEAGQFPGYYRHGGHSHWHRGYWGAGYWGPWYGWRGGYWGGGYWGGGYWGPGWGWGYWGPPAVVYSPVVVPEARVYVERDEAVAPPSTPDVQWWYWCASSRQYYPYVSTCSEGWQRVPPQPVQAPK